MPNRPAVLDEIHVWELDLGCQPVVDPSSDLQRHEVESAERILSREARRRFVTRRSALRGILGGYLGVPARSLDFDAPPGEKPRLAASDLDLRFNLTHAGDTALLGVLVGREVGVDIEPLAAGSRLREAAIDLLSPGEHRELETLSGPDLVSYLTRVWVRKEAYAKAIGTGLRISLRNVEFDITGPWGVVRNSAPPADGRTWSVADLEMVDGHAAAVVVEGSPAPIRVFKWPAAARDAAATPVSSGHVTHRGQNDE